MTRLGLLASAAVLALAPAALAQIPNNPDAPTMSQFLEASAAHERAASVEAYQKTGNHDPKWDAAATGFLEHLAQTFAKLPQRPSQEALEREGRAVVDLGCDDPMVLYGYGFALDRRPHHRDAEIYLLKAAAGMAISKYPLFRHAAVHMRLAGFLAAWGRGAEADRYYETGVDLMIRAVRAGDWPAGSERKLFRDFEPKVDNELPSRHAEALLDGLARVPTLDPWVLKSLQGVYEVRVAWEKRGKSYASKVKPEQWAGFEEHLSKARAALTEAFRLQPKRPEAPTYMIAVAMGSDRDPNDTPRIWFDRAAAAQIDWEPAYRKLLWSLYPRWGGSYEAMLEFGRQCAKTGRYDTRVPYQFIQAVIDIYEDSSDAEVPWRNPAVYATARDTLTRLADSPAHKAEADSFRSLLAAVAWQAKRYDDAAAMLKALEGRFDDEAASRVGGSRRLIADETAVFTCSTKAKTRAAVEALERSDTAAGKALFEAALAGLAPEETAARSALRDWLDSAAFSESFLAGNTVEPKFVPGLPGWRSVCGDWTIVDEGHIRGVPGRDGLGLLLNCPVGGRFVLEADVDADAVKGDNANAGLIFGRYWTDQRSPDLVRALIYRQQKAVVVRAGAHAGGKPAPLHPGPNHIRLTVWDKRATVEVNGERVWAGAVPRHASSDAPVCAGLGGLYWDRGEPLTFGNPKLRKLDQMPDGIEPAPGPPAAAPRPAEATPTAPEGSR